MLKNAIALSWLILLIGIGCQKDTEQFIIDSSNTFLVTINGYVTDAKGTGISDALISYDGNTVMTDSYGHYSFKNVTANNKHNFVLISKNGYFDGCRSFSASHNGSVDQVTFLYEKKFNSNFDSKIGATIDFFQGTLLFNPQSVIDPKSGQFYNGNVNVAYHYIDPTDFNIDRMMPGNLSAINNENILSVLTSFGMIDVELQDDNGNKLQLDPKKGATIKCKVPTTLLDQAPKEVAMWHFDLSNGFWIEEGSAILNDGYYIGVVNHFSCWNYDDSKPSITLSGRVVDQNGSPISSASVSAKANGSYYGGHGFTQADGTFSGKVPKNEMLTFEIRESLGYCPSTNFYQSEIGPFDNDTDLGDIVINIPQDQRLNISAKFVDCNGVPVNDGFVEVFVSDYFAQFFEIINGNFSQQLHLCLGVTLRFKAVDRNLKKETVNYSVATNGDANFGEIKICDSDADYFYIENVELGFNTTVLDSLYVYANGSQKYLSGYNAIQSNTQNYFYLNYDDGNSSDMSQGTFDLFSTETSFVVNGTRYFFTNNGSPLGTVNITEVGKVGEKIKGSFSINSTSPQIKNFTGNFSITR